MPDNGGISPNAQPVAVIDHGHANLFSLGNALRSCGARVQIVDDPNDPVLGAGIPVVLPGVGAFGEVMHVLAATGFDGKLREIHAVGTPILGICLGMQLLFGESEEFGRHKGLNIIAGRVAPIAAAAAFDGHAKIPHVGWARITVTGEDALTAAVENEWMYFVHSNRVIPDDPSIVRAGVVYAGVEVPAVVRDGNVMGCQFHPEKSGERGMGILKNFLALTASAQRET